jgi:hypothetical protein
MHLRDKGQGIKDKGQETIRTLYKLKAVVFAIEREWTRSLML